MQNLRQRSKIFNYRPLVLVLLAVISGILFACFFYEQFVTVICLTLICLAILVYYSILHKTFKYALVFFIAFCVGFLVFKIFDSKLKPVADDYTDYVITGTVFSRKIGDGSVTILAKDLQVDGKELGYNAVIYYYNTSDVGYTAIEVGHRISFTADKWAIVEDFYKENGEPITYYANNDIKVVVGSYNVDVIEYIPSTRTKILKRIRRLMGKALSNQNADMVYSAMFGDKSDLDSELYTAYQCSGVAHLLAVSGLHVGLVVAILSWILKKCKSNSVVSIILIGIFLLFYSYLCDFAYSVMRASIMAIILSGAYLLCSAPDMMSSMSCAGIVIFLIFPQAVFEVSSLLSFGCVLGIAMLYKPIHAGFAKIKFPEWLSSSLAMSLSTQIVILGTMCKTFSEVGFSGILANLVVLPMFSALFSYTFAIIMLSLIIPQISYLLFLVNPLFEIMNWVIIFIANNAHLSPSIQFNYLSMMLWIMLMAFVGRFNVSSKKRKFIQCLLITFVLSFQLAYW